MKRLLISLVLVFVAILVLEEIAHRPPYGKGELTHIYVQFGEIDTARVAIRDQVQIEEIRKNLRLVPYKEISLCDYSDEIVFCGSGFQDEAAINCALINFHDGCRLFGSYKIPKELGLMVESYKDSARLFEPWESRNLQWAAKKLRF